jgi:hypothetical protein
MRLRIIPFALLLLTACADAELVGIHIALTKDGSGTLTARALQATSAPGPAEARMQGVQWQVRANLWSSQGSFRSLSDLVLGDREVRFLTTNEEMPHLRVIIKRGRDLAWVQALVPDQETRKALARVHDPNSKSREIADSIRLEVQFPDTVISSGVEPAGRGVEATHERNRAYLILPVQTLQQPGDDLVWAVSWK